MVDFKNWSDVIVHLVDVQNQLDIYKKANSELLRIIRSLEYELKLNDQLIKDLKGGDSLLKKK